MKLLNLFCAPLQDDEQLTSSDLVEFREALCKHNSRFKPKALSDYIIWGKPFIGAKHRAAKYHNLRKYLTLTVLYESAMPLQHGV